jgi:thymidylate synthase
MNKLDLDYQNLLKDILENGVKKETRNGGTISVFGRQIRHKMSEGFPLLTTKKMPWKSIVTELLWFLQGNTNIKWLVENGCNIWNGDAYKNYVKHNQFNSNPKWLKPIPLENGDNGAGLYSIEEFINKIKEDDEFAKKWGELGPIYGKQWRKWDSISDSDFDMRMSTYEVDQIQNLINDLKTNPDSRRLMVNAWNVGELDQMVLPPCHYGFQVYTRELSLEERLCIADKFNPLIREDCLTKTHHPDETEELKLVYRHEFLDSLGPNVVPQRRAISLMWNQRSVDTFLGLPFNIASYGLLLEIIAKEVNMVPEELIGNLGDVHLYSNHIEQAKEQIGRKYTHEERTELLKQAMGEENYNKAVDELMPFGGGLSEYFGKYNISPGLHTRKPFPLPTLKFNPCPITGISMEYQSIAQFQIENYESHPTIKAPLSN